MPEPTVACVSRIAVYYIFCTRDCKWQKPVSLNISVPHVAPSKALSEKLLPGFSWALVIPVMLLHGAFLGILHRLFVKPPVEDIAGVYLDGFMIPVMVCLGLGWMGKDVHENLVTLPPWPRKRRDGGLICLKIRTTVVSCFVVCRKKQLRCDEFEQKKKNYRKIQNLGSL